MPAPQPLVFLGATAFPEIAEIVRDINQVALTYQIVGILDDDPQWQGKEVEGVPVLGPLNEVSTFDDAQFVLGIGSYRTRITRYHILERLQLPRERFATLIHPMAKVYASATVGHGCILYPGVVVFNNTVVEDYALILANTVIGANNVVGEGALITSLVATTTHVVIGPYSHIGVGSRIAERVKVGVGAQISMGSLVLKDVPPGVFSFGYPPKYLDKAEIPPALLERWLAY